MIEADRDTIEAFASLFKGRTDCWGSLSVPEGRCNYEPVTLNHYERHLKGEVSLGIYFLLDDSTCHFFAVDLDQKDFNLAKAIRDELTKNNIPAYIAESKSRKYHIYGFALEKFAAKEIRRVLHHILNKLNIEIGPGSAEIFPKQDYHQPDDADGTKHPGSYINLPCFGHTRPFLSGDMKEVKLEVALKRIKFVPQEAIDRILRTLPKEKATRGRAKPSARERPGRSDEFNRLAIEKLLEHCAFIQHCRDEATTLSEPDWWSMVHILAVFGEPGREKIHELSQPYPRYSVEETDQKIEEALKAADKEIGPHTCVFIQQDLGFVCPVDCQARSLGVKSPAGLAAKLARIAGLPVIVVTNRFLKEKTTDTTAAVERANNPPKIFERSGHIVRIGHDEFGTPYIETLTENACRGFLERAASYVRMNAEGEMVPLPAPPLDIVRDYMSLPNRNLPPLLGVTEIPILRSDGTIVTEPGYDEATHLYYEPAVGLKMPTVPDNPSQKELEAAVALIQEPIIDFPFDSQASRTNALAAIVTPIYRPMIAGPVPLCLIDKPQPGTGAGLLSDVIAIVATGRPAAMMAPPKNDEECEKRLTSILRHGRAVITIDNMDGYLYFPSLAMILTATTVQTRILGQSEELLLPNRATYIVTGNNVRLAGDLPRRCYLSRMDAREARPWLRDPKSFKYQHLIQWVKEHRGELLAAILTMARAWIAAGKPIPGGLPPLGGFEDWTNTVGSILIHAGLPDFLDNLDFMYSQSDMETSQWENFLAAWQEILGGDAVTIAQVVESINDNGILASALPDVIDRDPKKLNRSLARALIRRAGVRYPNGLMVAKSDKVVHHAVAWQVINYREGSQKGELENPKIGDLDTKGELGELATTPNSYASKSEKEEKEIYEYGVKPYSPNSPLASKRGELDPETTPLHYTAVLRMPVKDAIEIWRSAGAPVIHLGPGVNCLDLGKLLARTDVSPEHLEAVKVWLQKQQGGNYESRSYGNPI